MKIDKTDTIGYFPSNWTVYLQNSWMWKTHVYGLAISWFILGLYVFIAAINLRSGASYKRILNRICGYLCLVAILRAVYLLIDPYETKSRLERWISRSLYIVIQPVILIIFLLCFIVLLKFTSIHIRPKALENPTFFQFFCLGFSSALIALEIGVYFRPESILPILILVEFFYVCFHCFVIVAFMHYGIRMLRKLGKTARASHIKCYNLKRGDPHAISNLSLPRIRITDENERSLSYRSEISSFHSMSSDGLEPERRPDGGEADPTVNGETPLTSSSIPPISSTAAPINQETSRFSALGIPRRKKLKKRGSRDSKSDPSKLPRTRRLCGLIRGLYLGAICGLLQCAWMCYDRLGRTIGWEHLAGDPQAWFVVQTVFRVTEIFWAGSMGYAVRHGFNRL